MIVSEFSNATNSVLDLEPPSRLVCFPVSESLKGRSELYGISRIIRSRRGSCKRG